MVIIKEEADCEIKPKDIYMGERFYDAFGNSETEISARYIVRLCQRIGWWKPFTRKEIEAFYNESGNKGYTFNWLIDRGWIVKKQRKFLKFKFWEKFYITTEFVERVFQSAERNKKT